MSYIVIARRWRPQVFEDIIGQDHVSKTLANAIANDRIAHAYIFTGPRGVGKTTTARILAKALNCEKGPTPVPCNECASCKAITEGNSMDVLEIDGASNRGIDEIRNLRENIRFTPSMGKYRIYIIDEVHMLTKEAFNALLKTLEEPPEHALFIFATTEIHKVPATILSRCQRFDFHRMPLKTIMEHIRHICEKDAIDADEDALLQIAKKADGSMRDAQSILDQIISFSGKKITFEDVAQALGVIHQDIYFELDALIRAKDLKGLILKSADIISSGYDLNEFLLGFEEHLRNILVTHTLGSTDLLETSEEYLRRYKETADQYSENDLLAALQVVADTINAVKNSQQPQLKFELGLLRMAKLPSTEDISTLLEKIDLLKKKAPLPVVADSAASAYHEASNQASSSEILDKSYFVQKWPDIVKSVHDKRPSLSVILEKAEITELEGQQLHILLREVDSFQKDMLQSAKSLIEKILREESSEQISIHLKYNLKKEAAKKTAKAKIDKETRLKELLEKEPAVGKIIDEFDLELID